MRDPQFVHLRVHSDFSMVDGLYGVKPIIAAAADQKMAAIAITDQGNMCGLVRFLSAAQGAGIKPVIGADLWLKGPHTDDNLYRLVALCANNTGYQNLTMLISKAYLRGHVAERAVVERDWLIEHAEGVILLSGGRDGDIGQGLLGKNPEQVADAVAFYQQHFADRFYLELTRTGRPNEEDYLHLAVALADQHQLPVVATNEVMFLTRADFDAHEVRTAIHDGYMLEDKRRPRRYSEQQYLRSEAEMCALFEDIPEALANSVEIAKRCNVTVRLGEYFLPNFPTGDLSIEDFLVKVSEEGLEERLEFLFPEPAERAEKRGEYDERLKIELDVINQMGFPGYFLIVMEFIQWSKDNNIPVGPGRGSGAGSLVAYALKITDLDPLEFDLLFERFLNPERVSMPDFDVDFCMDKRDKVIEHVAELYGRDAVSQIITFGTMAAKASIRDVGRVLGKSFPFCDRISKLIPGDPGMTLKKAFEAEPRLPELYNADDEVRELVDMARRLEGVTRNAGKHAGGVVIAPTVITDFAPLYCDDEGKNPVTQFDKNDVETAGLVKFDFLGLRTLTIIQWAIEMADAHLLKAGQPPIDIAAIPLDDPASFKLLLAAKTTAVFQLESRGMKNLIEKLKPDCFEDMIALVALFRPGPLQSGMVENFIDRKHGREEISYPDETWQHISLKPILEPTYGIILYQEQVMQIAQVLAGYTLGGADMLRRAMGKKKPEEMAKQRAVFEEGAIKNGVDGELAMRIFDLVEKFAGYGFNKSHSAAYALVSYQTLWMKTHYPSYFMAAVMSADMDNTDKIVTLVEECHEMGLTIIPPDVNSGLYRFSVNEDKEIVYGIGAIKGVGEAPVDAILEARQQGGPFRDIFDFCARVDLKRLNRRVMERLVKGGAFDQIGPHRAAIFAALPDAIKAAEQHNKAAELGQGDMFGLLSSQPEAEPQVYPKVAPWPDAVWLEGEKETLGLYLTGHPIDRYLAELKRYCHCRLNEVQDSGRGGVTVAGLVTAVRIRTDQRGRQMAILELDDKLARVDAALFGESMQQFEELLQKDKVLIVSGQVRFDDFAGRFRISVRDMQDIAQAREQHVRAIRISLTPEQLADNDQRRLASLLKEHGQGVCPMEIRYRHPLADATLQLGTQWRVTPSDELLFGLKTWLGEEHVEMDFKG